MEKIDIRDFSKLFIKGFSFLCEKYAFILSETREPSKKNDNTIIHKLIYTNTDIKRIIEFVLVAEDYKTHMFSRIGDTYVKRISANGVVPSYLDFANCFKIADLNELIQEKYSHSESSKYPENYIEKTQHIINHLEKVLTLNYWPSIIEIGDLQKKRIGFSSVGKQNVPYIDLIKAELTELINFGFETVFDETQIPPYEQSFMGPSISYYNNERKISIDITFQTRDQEFYVSSNENKNYFYGRAKKEEYMKLKDKILNDKKYGI